MHGPKDMVFLNTVPNIFVFIIKRVKPFTSVRVPEMYCWH